MTQPDVQIEAIDLYCGAGGLTCGLQQASIKVLAGVDLDSTCKFAFEENNGSKFIAKDIQKVQGAELNALFSSNSVKLLAGCAPCQPFSTYTHGNDAAAHSKWGLLSEFERLTLELEPDVVTMENVPQLVGHRPFDDFLATLTHMEYKIAYGVINCADFGVPQHRKRLVLLASKLGPIELPKRTHQGSWKSVRDAIGELSEIKAGEFRSPDALHRSASLAQINLDRIRVAKPGGNWSDWPRGLVARCHLKKKGKSFKSVYGRMSWDEPAPTMTTLCFGFGNGRFGHPEQDRAISLREAAIFQSFPPDYKFTAKADEITFRRVGRMIGNAVPPALGMAIGLTVVEHVRAHAKELS